MRCSSEMISDRRMPTAGQWPIHLLAVSLLLIAGCAHWQPDETPASIEGRQTAERLHAVNSGLLACKGLGQASLVTPNGVQRSRLAWAAQAPNKLRLELLSVSGHSLASVATDGRFMYLRDNTGGRFYRRRSSQASLEPIVNLPLRVPDLITYLLGRVPIPDSYHGALLDNPRKAGYILELSRRWGAVSQQILLDEDRTTVQKVVHLDGDGNPAYWVEFGKQRPVGEFSFPRRLHLTSATGDRIEIQMERFWPNVPIDDAAFRLTP